MSRSFLLALLASLAVLDGCRGTPSRSNLDPKAGLIGSNGAGLVAQGGGNIGQTAAKASAAGAGVNSNALDQGGGAANLVPASEAGGPAPVLRTGSGSGIADATATDATATDAAATDTPATTDAPTTSAGGPSSGLRPDPGVGTGTRE